MEDDRTVRTTITGRWETRVHINIAYDTFYNLEVPKVGVKPMYQTENNLLMLYVSKKLNLRQSLV